MSEISNVNSNEDISTLFNPVEAAVKEEVVAKEEAAVEAKQPVATEEKAQVVAKETIAKAEITKVIAKPVTIDVAKPAATVVAKPALPALNLKTISLKDIKKKDAALAKRHITDNAKNIKWDAARGVVILDKSGKTRAYQIGRGSGPALIETKHKNEVTAFIKRMK